MNNYPDGAYGAVMKETAPHHPECENGTWYWCKESFYSGSTGHAFPANKKGSANFCYDHFIPAQSYEGCVCDRIEERDETW